MNPLEFKAILKSVILMGVVVNKILRASDPKGCANSLSKYYHGNHLTQSFGCLWSFEYRCSVHSVRTSVARWRIPTWALLEEFIWLFVTFFLISCSWKWLSLASKSYCTPGQRGLEAPLILAKALSAINYQGVSPFLWSVIDFKLVGKLIRY